MRYAYKILVGKHVGRTHLGRPALRWDDNIIMDLREIEWEVVDWIHVAQERDQSRAIMSNETSASMQGRNLSTS